MKETNHVPYISQVSPAAAIPGGEFLIRGRNFAAGAERPRVQFGETHAAVVVGSDSFVVARVPDGVVAGQLVVRNEAAASKPFQCEVGIQIADSLHPVANPAIDAHGNVFSTFSGSRGQKTPVSVYKIDTNFHMKPFLSDVMNATGLAFDRDGLLYISSRYEGTVYQVTPKGAMSVYV